MSRNKRVTILGMQHPSCFAVCLGLVATRPSSPASASLFWSTFGPNLWCEHREEKEKRTKKGREEDREKGREEDRERETEARPEGKARVRRLSFTSRGSSVISQTDWQHAHFKPGFKCVLARCDCVARVFFFFFLVIPKYYYAYFRSFKLWPTRDIASNAF